MNGEEVSPEERSLLTAYVSASQAAATLWNQAQQAQAKAIAAGELRDEALAQYRTFVDKHSPAHEQHSVPRPATIEADPDMLSPMTPSWP